LGNILYFPGDLAFKKCGTSVPVTGLYGRKKSGRFAVAVRHIEGVGRDAAMPDLKG
jgi:hypothetical protein